MKQGENGEAGLAAAPPSGRAQLMEGIERDARAEAAEITKAEERAAAERRKVAEAQAASILEEARRRAQETVRGIARQGEQAAAVETRRMGLKVREEISRRVVEEAARKLAGMIRSPAYRDVLRGWIVEAALGLNAAEAEVLASGPEMAVIDDALLAAAAAELKALSGVEVRLRRSAAHPLVGQGVVVTARDGRTAFNNQVATRMERYQSEIRKLIYEALKES
jgi:vacuolar-type H+-ATPase subunit E/Vma4